MTIRVRAALSRERHAAAVALVRENMRRAADRSDENLRAMLDALEAARARILERLRDDSGTDFDRAVAREILRATEVERRRLEARLLPLFREQIRDSLESGDRDLLREAIDAHPEGEGFTGFAAVDATLLLLARGNSAAFVAGLTQTLETQIVDAVNSGVVGSSSYADVAKKIGATLQEAGRDPGVFGTVATQLERVHRTESSKLYAQARRVRMAELEGHTSREILKRWVSIRGDGRTRPSHLALRDVTIPRAHHFVVGPVEPFVVVRSWEDYEADGDPVPEGATKALGPLDSVLPPREIIQCRCAETVVFGRVRSGFDAPENRPKPKPETEKKSETKPETKPKPKPKTPPELNVFQTTGKKFDENGKRRTTNPGIEKRRAQWAYKLDDPKNYGWERTIEGAQKMARRFGVNVTFGQTGHWETPIAEMYEVTPERQGGARYQKMIREILLGVADLRAHGIDDEFDVLIDAAEPRSELAGRSDGRTVDDIGAYADPWTGENGRVVFSEASRNGFGMRVEEVRETMRHEAGHVLHWKRHEFTYRSVWADIASDLKRENAKPEGERNLRWLGFSPAAREALEHLETVTSYAKTNPLEFVAETFDQLMKGSALEPKQLEFYTYYGGPDVKLARGNTGERK